MDTKLLAIPVIAGVIGYATNWLAIKLLFLPVEFHGVRFPGLRRIVHLLPRKLQAIPGFAHGGIGWQGIIPSRAAKMGSIAVDKGIAKLGSPAEFYEELEPHRIAELILTESREDIRALAVGIIQREHPRLWEDLPPALREAVVERAMAHLPEIVNQMTDDIGENIEQLIDIKLMVIRQIEREPALANKISQGIGDKELNFVINSGFIFGFLLGIPQILAFNALDHWTVLAVGGVAVGLLTNWIALKFIFLPVNPHRIGPFNFQGMFMRRQPEVAQTYATVVAEDIVTLQQIGEELIYGPQSDRTRQMIENRLRPAVDRAVGAAAPAVRVAVGTKAYDTIKDTLAAEAVEYTMQPFSNPDFNVEQSARIQALLSERIEQLPPDDYAELLRGAIREDEWMLIALGAALGFAVAVIQVMLLFGGVG